MTRPIAEIQWELDAARHELALAQRKLEDAELEVSESESEIENLKRELLGAADAVLPDGRSVLSFEPLLQISAGQFVQLDTLRTLALIDRRFEAKLAEVERVRLGVAA